MYKPVKTQIEEKLTEAYEPGEVNAGQVYKGVDYDGVVQANGWWFQPFNRRPVHLGKSKTEALATIEDWDA